MLHKLNDFLTERVSLTNRMKTNTLSGQDAFVELRRMNAAPMVLDWERIEEFVRQKRLGEFSLSLADAIMLWFDEVEVPEEFMLPACGYLPSSDWPGMVRVEIGEVKVNGRVIR